MSAIDHTAQAINQLRVYIDDDQIDRETLGALVDAYDRGNRPVFVAECKRVLGDYAASHYAIDWLYEWAEKQPDPTPETP